MNYKAVIIDDEPKLREVLDIKLGKSCPDISVIGKLKNAKEGYSFIIEHKPDLVFLDISMPGESGFDMLERFEIIDFEIIFVTGFNEYGLDALKVSAVDYVLKPVKTEDLINAVEKAKNRIDNKEKINRYELLKQNVNEVGNQKTRIAIPGMTAYEFLKINEIVRVEGWQKYSKIYTTNGETIVSSYNIGVFRDILEKYDFFQTHKSHIINKNLIKRYLKEGVVVMDNGDQVPVSRRKKEEFLEEVLK